MNKIKRYEGDEQRIEGLVEFITVQSYKSWNDCFRKVGDVLDEDKYSDKYLDIVSIKHNHSAHGYELKLIILKDVIADKKTKKNMLFLRDVAKL